MFFVVLGLGSNQVFASSVQNFNTKNTNFVKLQPIEILQKACIALSVIIDDITLSSVYTSKAMYVTNQSDFFNMAICGLTSLSPELLLTEIQKIETKWGRDRSKEFRNGPRTLDIDIELYGTQNVHTENLVIPHPRLCERQFVLLPLVEILPAKKDVCLKSMYKNADIPQRQKYVEYLEALKDQTVRKYCEPFTL